ncbi:hypothetical protein [Anaerophilus nitritogenes]|uniref:hypothetical protein n=1 Tax=Anaerophilus nitritogenes TaxID=2498136 RepID=UPI0013ED932B|nr:hypothetical protein [Anaerophilus nitritogenes]
MDDVKWKSDKHCIECRKKIRKEIIKEIQESCKDCKKMYRIENKESHKGLRK